MRRNRVYRLVILAMLTAVSIILTRFLVIYITNEIRISLGNIPIMLAGVWFGPLWGLVVGFVADFVGSTVFSPFGWYAPMTLTPMLMGAVAGLLAKLPMGKNSLARWGTVTFACNIPGTILWTTLCLSWMYGSPYVVLLTPRIGLYVCIAIGEAIVLYGINRISYVQARAKQFAQVKHIISKGNKQSSITEEAAERGEEYDIR